MSECTTRKELRHTLRNRRKNLTENEQTSAAQKLLSIVQENHLINDSDRIAVYLANDGEINPKPLIQWLWQLGVHCYLPVLNPHKKGELLFLSYQPDTPMVKNRFNIDEPDIHQAESYAAGDLDVVFMPLTGFTERGERMGMGGGFYDRTFAFVREGAAKPALIGLAHECQKVPSTYASEWDVPMQAVITDKACYRKC